MEILKNIDELVNTIVLSMGYFGAVFATLLIIIESILPVLPLGAFVTLNFLIFGSIWGFLISWISTVFGCMIAFFLFRKGFRKWFVRRIRKIDRCDRFMKRVENLKFQNFVILVAVPFTPAFLVNIAMGLSEIEPKRFCLGILFGKIFMVYFWGYVGTNLIASLTNPLALINVLIASGIAYVLSIVIKNKFNLN